MGPVLQELIAHCCKLLYAMNAHTQLFKVMKYIHSGNCIHRDLKVRYFLPPTRTLICEHDNILPPPTAAQQHSPQFRVFCQGTYIVFLNLVSRPDLGTRLCTP